MSVNNTMQIDKAKQLDDIRASAKSALTLLNLADYHSGELINRNLIDHKQASVISTYFERALDTVRELTEHLDNMEKGG